MQKLIDHRKISDAPYAFSENPHFEFELKEIFDQVLQDILNGNPTCCLVSGYRGVGKTSFINKIEEISSNENNKICFVKVNLPKYDGYNQVLRKLIRSIYLTISDKGLKISSETLDFLTSLYIKTFNQVEETKKQSTIKEVTSTFSFEFDLLNFIKKFLPFLFAGGIAALTIELISSLNDIFKHTLSLVFIIYGIFVGSIKSINLKKENKYSDIDAENVETKTLYDDEIAEHRVQELLNKLTREEYKMVIVFDELDKIDAEKAYSLISDLKPLLLSGQASYLLVTGQDLYYDYENGQYRDDSIITSIISKTIHVSLFSIHELKNLFNSIVENTKDDFIASKYLDSVTLRSNRVPRKFLNIIKQNVNWINKKSHLVIDDSYRPILETDSKLLEIIMEVENKYIHTQEYSEGIKDFFIMQLHIWVQKMMSFGKSGEFYLNDIYDYDRDYKKDNSHLFQHSLDVLIKYLLETMKQNKVMISSTVNKDEKFIDKYKWVEDVEIYFDNTQTDNIKSIKNSNSLRKLKGVVEEIYKCEFKESKDISYLEMINLLMEEEVIPVTNRLTNLLYVDFWDKQEEEMKYLNPVFTIEIISGFIAYTIKKLLDNSFEVKVNIDSGFDIIVEPKFNQKETILIEVKNFSSISRKHIAEIYEQVNKQLSYYNDPDKTYKVVLFIFCGDNSQKIKQVFSYFNDLVKKSNNNSYSIELFIQQFNSTKVKEWLTSYIINEINENY
ncbi:P-loop NTPase fold protein [Peribacillus simplex]|uniref:P-loop NTPase fold protein n=1 Tax=Peribacillus simplex TaxID=1478 RepID=UPI003D292642